MPNTIDILGDQATLDGLVSGTLQNLETDVNSIVNSSLSYSNGLESIKFTGLTRLTTYALRSSTNLKVAEFTNPSFSNLESYVFQDCKRLRDVIFHSNLSNAVALESTSCANTPIAIKHGAFYVPDNTISNYNTSYYQNLLVYGLNDYPVEEFGTIIDEWDDILESERDGTYLSKYTIGDSKTVYFDGYPMLFEIAAFDSDDLSDNSGKAHITWMVKNSFFKLSFTNANWINSNIRSSLNAMLNRCDVDFRNALKEVKKVYRYGTNTTSDLESNDKVFIPSLRELNIESSSYTIESSGPIYSDYFPDNNSRIRYDISNAACTYYTRSSNRGTGSATYISSSGSSNYTSAITNEREVVFGFCT